MRGELNIAHRPTRRVDSPFTPYRPSASGNIVRQYSRESLTGLTPSNMGQPRVGLQGLEPIDDEWSAVFQVETFFNPQSGADIGDYVLAFVTNNAYSKSKTVNVYWTGVRYTVIPHLDLTVAYWLAAPR